MEGSRIAPFVSGSYVLLSNKSTWIKRIAFSFMPSQTDWELINSAYPHDLTIRVMEKFQEWHKEPIKLALSLSPTFFRKLVQGKDHSIRFSSYERGINLTSSLNDSISENFPYSLNGFEFDFSMDSDILKSYHLLYPEILHLEIAKVKNSSTSFFYTLVLGQEEKVQIFSQCQPNWKGKY